jgi:hypothetical protein
VNKKTDKFALESFNNPKECEKYFDLFGLDQLLGLDLLKGNSDNKAVTNVDPTYVVPYGIEIPDLCRLHWICLNRKSTQVLEFGSGYSTLVFANALSILRNGHGDWAKNNTRLQEPFKLYSVEESPDFAEITKTRLGAYLDLVDLSVRSVSLTEINGRYATLYDTLPNTIPDLIYLDGPSQYATDESIAGFSINDTFRMPMAADLLRIEYFLEPGTVILVDGRTANASFLKNNFQRNWKYMHDVEGDFHLFELQDPFLGKLNADKFNYCTDGKWLLK